jgi:Arm DNA-binding domain
VRGGETPALTYCRLTHVLTDTKLRGLKPKANVYRVADTNGLCIEVRPTGAKLWRYPFRYIGKASMAALGEYPMMTPGEARAERDRMRSMVKGGANPAHVARIERATQVERAEATFAAVATELLAKRAKERLSSGSVKRERRLIEKDLAGIGVLPVAGVIAPALLAALRKLERRGVIETAPRARSFTGLVFRYAIAIDSAESNRAADLIGALEKPQLKHFASITETEKVGELLRTVMATKVRP